MGKPFDIYVNDLRLTPEDYSIITEAKGINPVKAELTSLRLHNRDGSIYQGATIGNRNIVLTISIPNDVLTVRETVLSVLKTGEDVKMRFENDKTYYIDGVIESVEYDRFVKPTGVKQIIQASIICFEPFFYGEEQSVEFSRSSSQTIAYTGEINTGFVVEETDTAPINHQTLELSNGVQSLKFGQEFTEYVIPRIDAKKIVVDTISKNAYYLDQNDEQHSLLGYWVKGSEWLTLFPGSNALRIRFGVISDTTIMLNYSNKYNRL